MPCLLIVVRTRLLRLGTKSPSSCGISCSFQPISGVDSDSKKNWEVSYGLQPLHRLAIRRCSARIICASVGAGFRFRGILWRDRSQVCPVQATVARVQLGVVVRELHQESAADGLGEEAVRTAPVHLFSQAILALARDQDHRQAT